MFWKVESYLDDAMDPNLEDAAGDGLGKSSETTLQAGAFEWWRQCQVCEHRQQWSSTGGWLKIEAVVFLTCLFCPFLRWSQMVLTLVKWCKVVLMTAVGAHCVRTGTVGGGRAAMWARVWLSLAAGETERLAPQGREAREKERETPETGVVADVVEGISVEAETLVPRERVRQLTAEQAGNAPQFREETVDEELRVAAAAIGKPVVRARPLGFAKYNATTESVLGESPGEAGSSGSRAGGAISAATATVARFDERARPLGIAKNSATSKADAGHLGPETVARPAQPLLQQM